MSLSLPQTHGYNLRHTMLQSQAENNRFHWQTPKPLIKTPQHRHIKTSSHASIFWDLQHVIWDQLFVGTQSPKLTNFPCVQREGEKKKKRTPTCCSSIFPLQYLLLHMMSIPTVSHFRKLLIPVLPAHSPGWHHWLRLCQLCSIKPRRVSVWECLCCTETLVKDVSEKIFVPN